MATLSYTAKIKENGQLDLPQEVQTVLDTHVGEVVEINIYLPDNGATVKNKRRKAGSAKSIILAIAKDFDAPLEDFEEYR